eukprot:TRINITY_DN2661_c0_g1_i1.p1 TRINITY_DN2661_c0_g1~~TRINITY_DN2661_c0_g1_i1.p1  ORF type:complete len:614 (+),score=135.44 TRINITY_DN2661_c0_g1_i1:476-2317(+)
MNITISVDKKGKDPKKAKGEKKNSKKDNKADKGKKDNKKDNKKDDEQCQWPPDQQTIIIVSSISGTVTAAIAALIIIVALIPPPVTLMIQSGHGNDLWIRAMVDKFNGSPHFTTTGALIKVELNITESDLDVDREPHLWIPASSMYIDMWNKSGMINASSCPSSSSSPMGIAMWKSMADLLGWNTGDITWADLHDVALNGWVSVGGTYGGLNYAHSSPYSTHSGLVSILSQIHAFSGVRSELEYNNVYNTSSTADIQVLEDSIVYYGSEDEFLMNMMLVRGFDIIHAVVTYEGNVIKYNMEHSGELEDQLVFIYPVDGIFWNDHPLCVLNNTGFTSVEQADAAQVFIEFLLEDDQQKSTVLYGVRPADISADITSMDGNNITTENGAIPTITPSSTSPLPAPKESIITQVKNLWKQAKSPATIYLLIDSSPSMINDNKMKGAIDSALALLDSLDPNDRIIISVFNDTVSNINDIYLSGETQISLIDKSLLTYQMQSLVPQEGFNLLDSIATALDSLEVIKAADAITRRYSLVVINNGIFNITERFPTPQDFLDYLPLSDDPTNVKLYTVAYGNDVNGFTQELLKTVASNRNGKYHLTYPDDIVDLFVGLTSEF